jgi:hypothetical protein
VARIPNATYEGIMLVIQTSTESVSSAFYGSFRINLDRWNRVFFGRRKSTVFGVFGSVSQDFRYVSVPPPGLPSIDVVNDGDHSVFI